MIVLSIISLFYNQFRTNKYIAVALQVMRAGVAAVIFDVVINLAKNVFKTHRILYIAMMIIAFVCTYFLGVSAMIVILVCLGIGLLDLLVSVLKEKHKRRSDNAFTEIIFFIYTSRSVQRRRRLCRNSAYSGTNSKHTPPYDYGGIFRPYHCCGNDPGSYIHKFINICRYAYRRYRRCVALFARLYHSVICHMLYTRVFLL